MNEELYDLPDKDREDNEANAAFFTINVVSFKNERNFWQR